MALIVISLKGELRQPQNNAMGRISKGYVRWQVAQQYLYDIERILREIKMAYSLILNIPDEEFLKNHSTNKENYIMYHQGYFLDLTHQLKDKLCQLIRAIAIPEKDNLQKKAEKRKKLLNKLFADIRVQRIPGLVDLLKEWDSENHNGSIVKALKKRTNYHHYKNPLSAVESYVQTNSLRSMLEQNMSGYLSEYGKQVLTEKMEKNLQEWQINGAEKMNEIIEKITENLEGISRTLVKYYKFPSFASSSNIVNWEMKLWDQIKVKKSASAIENVSEKYRGVVEAVKELLISFYGDQLVAVYLTGSILRNDFVPYLSDINFLTVVKNTDKFEQVAIKTLLFKISKSFGPPINNEVFAEEEFSNPINEKARFICRSEGVLLFGKDLLENDKDQKICFNLAWLLNKDFKNYIAKIKTGIEDKSISYSENQLSSIARILAKRGYWLSFSMVIGNNVLYTSNFKKMRELQNLYYPDNKKFNESIFRIMRNRVKIDRETLSHLIKRYEELLFPLYETMEAYCDEKNPRIIPDKSN